MWGRMNCGDTAGASVICKGGGLVAFYGKDVEAAL